MAAAEIQNFLAHTPQEKISPCHTLFAFKFAKPGIYISLVFSKCLPYIESAWKLAFVFTGDLFRHFPVLRWWISILFFVESKETTTGFFVHLPFFNFNIPIFVSLFTVQVLYAIAFKILSLQNVNYVRRETLVIEIFQLS